MSCSTFAKIYGKACADAWRPSEQLTVSQWADKYRIIPPKNNPEPGPWRTARTPYAREIMDSLSNPRIREVVCVKPAQCAGSAIGRNWIGHTVDIDPGPMIIVFPTEASVRENMEERILPMFKDCPRLRRYVTGRKADMKMGAAHLTSCSIFTGYSGSPAAVAQRAIMKLYFDEVDKMQGYRGVEADALSLSDVRTKTYQHRRKKYVVSTPTIPSGPIMRAYEACPDRRTFHVTCRECGEHEEFAWSGVKWAGMEKDDAESLHGQLAAFDSKLLEAHYEFKCCQSIITDKERLGYVADGIWVSAVEVQHSESVGFKISGLSSPFTSLTELAREYVSARLTGLDKLQGFYNSFLGEPFYGLDADSGQAAYVSPDTIYHKQCGHARGLVPQWATVLVAGADTQKNSFVWVVRAYGKGYRSRLVDFGVAESEADLKASTLDREYDLEGSPRKIRPLRLMIDSGGGRHKPDATRTEEVYRFSKTNPVHIMPIKGHGGSAPPREPVASHPHVYRYPGQEKKTLDVVLTIIDVEYFKDLMASRINDEDKTLWEVCDGLDRNYVQQMTAQRRDLIKREILKDLRIREIWRWVSRPVGAKKDYWDAENYCAAGAFLLEADRAEPAWPTAADPRPRREDEDDPGWWSGARGDKPWI